MAGRRPIFAENFSANLAAIEAFLGQDGASAFTRLLDRLFGDIIPTVCRFPESGRAFFTHSVRSAEVRILVKRLRSRLRDAKVLREFIAGDYLVLYLVRRERIVFLSIKHHRQLSFDLRRFWQEP